MASELKFPLLTDVIGARTTKVVEKNGGLSSGREGVYSGGRGLRTLHHDVIDAGVA